MIDRSDEYRERDLHQVGGDWPKGNHRRYGGVVLDAKDRVLLREPTNHFDNYHWTFPKGAPEPGEHPVDTALREVFEETGRRPIIIDHLPGVFRGRNTSSSNYFYLMRDRDEASEPLSTGPGAETAAIRWATLEEAEQLIVQTTNPGGRERDLATLRAAVSRYRRRLMR